MAGLLALAVNHCRLKPAARSSVRNVRMTVVVKLFALLRDRAGVAEVMLDMPPGTTVASAVDRLAERFPATAALLSRTLVAVNQDYVDRAAELHEGDELALIPPVSGG